MPCQKSNCGDKLEKISIGGQDLFDVRERKASNGSAIHASIHKSDYYPQENNPVTPVAMADK
jgi:hypothetical protein